MGEKEKNKEGQREIKFRERDKEKGGKRVDMGRENV